MNDTLLEQFLKEECTPYVHGLLQAALTTSAPPCKRFEFDRFEVTVDREGGIVLVEDVLDATDAGMQRIPLAEFTQALDKRSP